MAKAKGKSGRLSNAELDYFRASLGQKTPARMVEETGRSLEVVLATIERLTREQQRDAAAVPAPAPAAAAAIRLELKQSPVWRRLSQELERDELAYFEDRYVALMEQFKDDVLATEENQIFKAIKYDIMMGRNMAQQKTANRVIAHIEREQERLATLGDFNLLPENQKEYFLGLDSQLQDALKRKQDLSKEYVQLDEKHQRLLEDLKATRKQRIDKIESGKLDFLGLLRMLQEDAVRVEEDRQIELMRRATAGEAARLSRPHRYSDGTFDLPLLTPQTVALHDEADDAAA